MHFIFAYFSLKVSKYCFFCIFQEVFGQVVPFVTLGLVAFIAGCLALFLPETKDANLPSTIEEGERIPLRMW